MEKLRKSCKNTARKLQTSPGVYVGKKKYNNAYNIKNKYAERETSASDLSGLSCSSIKSGQVRNRSKSRSRLEEKRIHGDTSSSDESESSADNRLKRKTHRKRKVLDQTRSHTKRSVSSSSSNDSTSSSGSDSSSGSKNESSGNEGDDSGESGESEESNKASERSSTSNTSRSSSSSSILSKKKPNLPATLTRSKITKSTSETSSSNSTSQCSQLTVIPNPCGTPPKASRVPLGTRSRQRFSQSLLKQGKSKSSLSKTSIVISEYKFADIGLSKAKDSVTRLKKKLNYQNKSGAGDADDASDRSREFSTTKPRKAIKRVQKNDKSSGNISSRCSQSSVTHSQTDENKIVGCRAKTAADVNSSQRSVSKGNRQNKAGDCIVNRAMNADDNAKSFSSRMAAVRSRLPQGNGASIKVELPSSRFLRVVSPVQNVKRKEAHTRQNCLRESTNVKKQVATSQARPKEVNVSSSSRLKGGKDVLCHQIKKLPASDSLAQVRYCGGQEMLSAGESSKLSSIGASKLSPYNDVRDDNGRLMNKSKMLKCIKEEYSDPFCSRTYNKRKESDFDRIHPKGIDHVDKGIHSKLSVEDKKEVYNVGNEFKCENTMYAEVVPFAKDPSRHIFKNRPRINHDFSNQPYKLTPFTDQCKTDWNTVDTDVSSEYDDVYSCLDRKPLASVAHRGSEIDIHQPMQPNGDTINIVKASTILGERPPEFCNHCNRRMVVLDQAAKIYEKVPNITKPRPKI